MSERAFAAGKFNLSRTLIVDSPCTLCDFDKVDTVRRCNGALEWRRDESADEIGICSNVNSAHRDRRAFELRVLPNVEGANGLETSYQDDQVDHNRKDGSADEKIRKLHVITTVLSDCPDAERAADRA